MDARETNDRPLATPNVDADTTHDAPQDGKKSSWWRIALLIAMLGSLALAAHLTGLTAMEPEAFRVWVRDNGALGAAGFVGLWSLADLIQAPSPAFIAASLWAYGAWIGALIAWIGSLVCLSTTYILARTVAGTPLEEVEHPWIRRALDHLDRRPILTLAALRAVFFMNPAVSYPAILAGVRYRDYMAGSALGLTAPIGLAALAFGLA